MTIRICVAGATGWVGRPLCALLARTEGFELVGAVSRTHSGRRLGEVIGEPGVGVTISGSVVEALTSPADVLVDFTRPDAVKDHTLAAIERGVRVVIGTSGLGEADFGGIDQAARARGVGVIAAGNFAITAVLLQRFAREAARHLSHWEIVDYASAGKVDSPSGTARELAHRLSEVRTPEIKVPIADTVGPRESRGASLEGMQVHSVRLPSFTLSVEVIFGEADERLTIRHDAGSGAAPYLQGTLLAIRRVGQVTGLVRGLENVME